MTRLPRHELARGALSTQQKRDGSMHFEAVMFQPLIALIFGILILLMPRILNYLIAIYLILAGIIGLFPHLITRLTG